MPSTLVHAFLPSTCVVTRKASVLGLSRRQVFWLFLVSAVIANMPDLDVVGVILFPRYSEFIHRHVGHNILSLAVWVILGRWLITYISPEVFKVRRAYVYSLALVLSHVILDSACLHSEGVPAGVPILWPFSDWQLVSPMPLFSDYALNMSHTWFLGHLLASDFWRRAIFQEVLVSATLWLSFCGLDRLSQRVFKIRTISSTSLHTETNVAE